MYRKVTAFLEKWKKDKYRKPLIVQGARQVGKTYSILEFGKDNYSDVAYFNFQTSPDLNAAFEESIDPKDLLPQLSRLNGQKITENTLVVFDEIQLCERALTSLKYFAENAKNYHVIAAGSLLGVAVNRKKYAFPVGKVDRYTMYPMDLEEYLYVKGEEELAGEIRSSYDNNKALPKVLHASALKLYREYLAIGGMPEVVSRFVETNDTVQVKALLDTLLMDYLSDMSKYQESANEIKKTRLVYETLPVQLSKKNTRFQYKVVKSGGRAAEYENAIEWLVCSNLFSRVYCCEQIKKPLDNYKNIDNFKIYFSDTGLLCAQKGLRAEDVFFMKKELTDFKGGLTENYVQTQLIRNGLKPYFWTNGKGTKEVDFVADLNGSIIPIEVKSGTHVKTDSLNEYTRLYKPEYAVRMSEKNFGFENNVKSVPLYAAFCIE